MVQFEGGIYANVQFHGKYPEKTTTTWEVRPKMWDCGWCGTCDNEGPECRNCAAPRTAHRHLGQPIYLANTQTIPISIDTSARK